MSICSLLLYDIWYDITIYFIHVLSLPQLSKRVFSLSNFEHVSAAAIHPKPPKCPLGSPDIAYGIELPFHYK